MESDELSRHLDRIIMHALAERRLACSPRGILRVVFTGQETNTLAQSLTCLEALNQAGYALHIAFSHTASQSEIVSGCLRWNEQHGIGALFDQLSPMANALEPVSVFLPGLSANSLAKIALGLRDNLACQWTFHALARQQSVTATLGAECSCTNPALTAQMSGYIERIIRYGIAVSATTPRATNETTATAISQNRQLISLKDVLTLPAHGHLYADRSTLITPAARDEIARRHITVIQQS